MFYINLVSKFHHCILSKVLSSTWWITSCIDTFCSRKFRAGASVFGLRGKLSRSAADKVVLIAAVLSIRVKPVVVVMFIMMQYR